MESAHADPALGLVSSALGFPHRASHDESSALDENKIIREEALRRSGCGGEKRDEAKRK
jgi:hypothetical protein